MDLGPHSCVTAKGYDAVCGLVNSNVCEKTLKTLSEEGVRLVLMRCAGFNNVDLDAAKKYGITVMRVPGYSPEAVAEHAMMLALAAKPSCPQILYPCS